MKNNNLIKFILVMLISFLLDGILTHFIPFDYSGQGLIVVSNIGLLVFIFMCRTLAATQRVLIAALTGLYYAVVYANSLYIYVLIYPIVLLAILKYFKNQEIQLFEYVIAGVICVLSQEIVIYALMTATGSTTMAGLHFVLYRILPTLAFTVVLAVLIYFIINKFEIARIRETNEVGASQDDLF